MIAAEVECVFTLLTDNDIIIRYEKEQVVGVTILNASNRKADIEVV